MHNIKSKNMNKIYAHFIRNFSYYWIIASIITCVFCIFYFKSHWNDEANCYSDNVIIEILSGVILSSIPLIIGYYVGQRFSNDVLLLNMRAMLKKISEKRKSGDFKDDYVARNLVIDISSELGREITNNDILSKISEKATIKAQSNTPCKICNLKYDFDIVNEKPKCRHCKLYSLAWDID